MSWQPISTAPKDGTRIEFRNEHNGLTDKGKWCDYSDTPQWGRELWPEWLHADEGEWSTDEGNGDMTHWKPIEDNQP